MFKRIQFFRKFTTCYRDIKINNLVTNLVTVLDKYRPQYVSLITVPNCVSCVGRISVSRPLDYEERKSYLLTVVARDMGIPPLSSQATVNVAVVDSNDNVPTFTQHLYSVGISEDTQVGTTIFEVCTRLVNMLYILLYFVYVISLNC